MSRVKIEHYVPQSYLAYFANKKNQVNVFDKSTQRQFISNIDRVAAEGKYFHFEGPESNTELGKKMNEEQLIEKFFSESVEGEFKQILDRIRARITMTVSPTFKVAITEDEKHKLALFLSIQMLRAKDFRQMLGSTSEKFSKAIFENDKFNGKIKETVKEISQIDQKVAQASMLFDDATIFKFAEVILNHSWIFYFNTTDVDFITSDNPVVRNGHFRESNKSNSGIASKGVEINFPISPNIILAMYEKSYHIDLIPSDNRIVLLNDKQYVEYYNYLQLSRSYKQIYSAKSLDDLLGKSRKDYPDSLEYKSKVTVYHNGKKY